MSLLPVAGDALRQRQIDLQRADLLVDGHLGHRLAASLVGDGNLVASRAQGLSPGCGFTIVPLVGVRTSTAGYLNRGLAVGSIGAAGRAIHFYGGFDARVSDYGFRHLRGAFLIGDGYLVSSGSQVLRIFAGQCGFPGVVVRRGPAGRLYRDRPVGRGSRTGSFPGDLNADDQAGGFADAVEAFVFRSHPDGAVEVGGKAGGELTGVLLRRPEYRKFGSSGIIAGDHFRSDPEPPFEVEGDVAQRAFGAALGDADGRPNVAPVERPYQPVAHKPDLVAVARNGFDDQILFQYVPAAVLPFERAVVRADPQLAAQIEVEVVDLIGAQFGTAGGELFDQFELGFDA